MVISALTYFFTLSYSLAVLANFLEPIHKPIAIAILFTSTFLSLFLAKKAPLRLGRTNSSDLKWIAPKSAPALRTILLSILGFCFVVGVLRETTDGDAYVYHLPLAILMNVSRWYPGICRLSSHFGFPNGNSVFTSLFTAWGWPGIENAPNLLVWILLGLATYEILQVEGLETSWILVSTLFVILFTPDLFWQAFNMGTDLPNGCFLFLGLWSWGRGNLSDAGLFLCLSALFKPIGQIAFGFWFVYMCLFEIKRPWLAMIATSLIASLSLLRIYIGTGNPLYPINLFPIAAWGVPKSKQAGLTEVLRGWTRIQHSSVGYMIFFKNLFFHPSRQNSGRWFSVPFLAELLVCGALGLQRRIQFHLRTRPVFIGLTITSLFVIWLYSSPLFRFGSGLFLILFVWMSGVIMRKTRGPATLLIQATILLTSIFFAGNASKHLYKDLTTCIRHPAADLTCNYPSNDDIYEAKTTVSGLPYIETSTTYIRRNRPPVITSNIVFDIGTVIADFYKYNPELLKRGYRPGN